MNDDSDLRKHFSSQRADVEARTPTFEHVLKRAAGPAHGNFLRVSAGASVAVGLVVIAIVEFTHSHSSPTPGSYVPPLADWRAATDVLLVTPDRQLLHTIPQIGNYPATFPGERS